MLAQLSSNWICWLMLVLAFFSYQQLCCGWLGSRSSLPANSCQSCRTVIGALPLLGLLGTIMGLQDCFVGMMMGGVDNERVSQGISYALVTTQLGLVFAIPGWLLLEFVRRDKPAALGWVR